MATQATRTTKAAVQHDKFVEAQLTQARRRIRLLDMTAALLGLVIGVAVYAAIMSLLDGWLEFSAGARQLGFGILALGVLAYLGVAVVWPLCRDVNPYYAARALEGTMPEAKNSLVNYLDLQDQPMPAAFKGAVAGRAARDLKKADVDEAISARRALTLTAAFAVVVLFLLGQLVFGGRQFTSILHRLFAPFGSTVQVATQTSLEPIEPTGDIQVPVGHPVPFTARVTGDVPAAGAANAVRLLYRYQPNGAYESQPFEVGVARDQWQTLMPAFRVRNGFWYKIAAGDAETPEYRVQVRATPLVTSYDVHYKYRPYLKWAERDDRRPDIRAMRGTEVTLDARTNRDVKQGELELLATGKKLPAELVPGEPNTLRFRFVIDRDEEYRIWFESANGEHNSDPLRHRIESIADAAPQLELTDPGKDVELPANGLLRLAGKASDDFGVTGMTLKMRVLDGPAFADKPYRDGKPEQFRLVDGSYPQQLEYMDFVALDKLRAAGTPLTPGMELEYWLEATDACDYPPPGPNVGKSRAFKVKLTKPVEPKERQLQENQARQDRQQHEKKQDQQQEKLNKKKQEGNGGEQNPEQPSNPEPRTPEQIKQDQETKKKIDDLQEELERKRNQGESKDEGTDPGASKGEGKPEEPGADINPNPHMSEPKPEPPMGEQTGESKGAGKPEPGSNPRQQQENKAEPKGMGEPQPRQGDPQTKPEGGDKKEGAQADPKNQGETKSGPKPEEQPQASGNKQEGKEPMQKQGEPKNQGQKQADNDPAAQPAQPKEKGADQTADSNQGTPEDQNQPSQAKGREATEKGEDKQEGNKSQAGHSSAKSEGKSEGGTAKGESRSGRGSDESVSKGSPKGEASGGGSHKRKAEGLANKMRQAQRDKNRAQQNQVNANSQAERDAAEEAKNRADRQQQQAEDELARMAKNAPSEEERKSAQHALDDAKRDVARGEIDRLADQMKSDDPGERETARGKLERMVKNAQDKNNQQAAKDALERQPAPQQKKIDDLANQAGVGKTDEEKKQAQEDLEKIADKSGSKADRKAAREALERLAREHGEPAPNQDKVEDLAKKMQSGSPQEKKNAQQQLEKMRQEGDSEAERRAASEALRGQQRNNPRPAPNQEKINEFAKKAQGGNAKEKQDAKQQLENIQKNGQNEADRQAAADALRKQRQQEVNDLAKKMQSGEAKERKNAEQQLEEMKKNGQSEADQQAAARALREQQRKNPQPAPNQDKIDQLAKKALSPDAKERQNAEQQLEDMKKNGQSEADRQAAARALRQARQTPRPAPNQKKIDELVKKMLGGADKQKKEAEQQLAEMKKNAQDAADRKAAEEAMEFVKRYQQNTPTPTQKRIEQLARQLRSGNEQQREQARTQLEQLKQEARKESEREMASKVLDRWGGSRNPEQDDLANRDADPSQRAGQLTLENFKKFKEEITPEMLRKLGYETPEQQAAFMKAAEDYHARMQREAERGSEDLVDPTRGGGNLNNIGARQVKSGDKDKVGVGGGAALPPPPFRDAFKEWSERISGGKPKR